MSVINEFGQMIVNAHRDLYNQNIKGARFTIGQLVNVQPASAAKFGVISGQHKVTSVNITDDGFEYTVENVGCLLWEHELSAIDEGASPSG